MSFGRDEAGKKGGRKGRTIGEDSLEHKGLGLREGDYVGLGVGISRRRHAGRKSSTEAGTEDETKSESDEIAYRSIAS